MVISFLETNKWFKGDIIYICDEGENCKLSRENRGILTKIYDNTIFLDIDSHKYGDIFLNMPNNLLPHFKKCLYKIEMFKKNDYKTKFYIDGDVLFLDNVIELFNEDLPYVTFCRDIISPDYFSMKYSIKGFNNYANLGFMLINDSIGLNFYDSIFNFAKTIKSSDFKNIETRRGYYAEQDIFNEFFTEALLIPSQIYDANVFNLGENINPKIIHFYGSSMKPWDSYYNNVFFDIWWEKYKNTKKIIEDLL